LIYYTTYYLTNDFCYNVCINKLYNKFKVGGSDENLISNSGEVFDFVTREWRMISSMCTGRSRFGLGVLNNLLYAVNQYFIL